MSECWLNKPSIKNIFHLINWSWMMEFLCQFNYLKIFVITMESNINQSLFSQIVLHNFAFVTNKNTKDDRFHIKKNTDSETSDRPSITEGRERRHSMPLPTLTRTISLIDFLDGQTREMTLPVLLVKRRSSPFTWIVKRRSMTKMIIWTKSCNRYWQSTFFHGQIQKSLIYNRINSFSTY